MPNREITLSGPEEMDDHDIILSYACDLMRRLAEGAQTVMIGAQGGDALIYVGADESEPRQALAGAQQAVLNMRQMAGVDALPDDAPIH